MSRFTQVKKVTNRVSVTVEQQISIFILNNRILSIVFCTKYLGILVEFLSNKEIDIYLQNDTN